MLATRAFVFLDFDNTLVELYPGSESLARLARDLRELYGLCGVLDSTARDESRSRSGRNRDCDGYLVWYRLHAAAARSLQGEAVAVNLRAERIVRDVEREAFSRAALLPGAREFLGALREGGATIGIVTSNLAEAVTNFFCEMDLPNAISVVVGRPSPLDLKKMKPNGAPLVEAFERVDDGSGARRWYIGDSADDMKAALAVDYSTIGVMTGGESRSTLIAAGASIVVPSVAAIDTEWLCEHFSRS